MFAGDRHRRAIEKFLKPIKIILLHQSQRVRPILGVEWKTPAQVMFTLKGQDEEMSGGTPEGRNKEISVQVSERYSMDLAIAQLINGVSDILQTIS